MEFIKKDFKKYIISIISIVIIFIVLLQCRKQIKFIDFYCTSIKNTETAISFVFPFVNKNIANDTFFTIAIGNNILKKGITNYDTLTWHENLKFPHSRNF